MVMKVEQVWRVLVGMKEVMMMVGVQTAFAGVNVIYKIAANQGINLSIVIAYRFLFATAFMLPLALFLERNERPKMTWKVLVQAFFCGLFGGSMLHNLYLESLVLTSATYTAAIMNLIPGVTFILAISFRLEKLRFKQVEGKAKVVGTLIGIGGAMLLTFYKGIEINPWSTNLNLLHHRSAGPSGAPPQQHHALGSLVALCGCLCFAIWLIIQAKMVQSYPCQYTSTALMTLMGSIQAVVYALIRERDWTQWKLGWNIRLLTVSYSGIVASGLCVTIMTWCVRMRGPVFVSIFNPLMLVITALVGSMILDEKLHLGSILGGGLIVCGLYVVLWGKSKEMKRMTSHQLAEQSVEMDVSATNNNNASSNESIGNIRNKSALSEGKVLQCICK